MQLRLIAAARYHLVNKADISTNRAREKTETVASAQFPAPRMSRLRGPDRCRTQRDLDAGAVRSGNVGRG